MSRPQIIEKPKPVSDARRRVIIWMRQEHKTEYKREYKEDKFIFDTY